jgi:hypothetical protein
MHDGDVLDALALGLGDGLEVVATGRLMSTTSAASAR